MLFRKDGSLNGEGSKSCLSLEFEYFFSPFFFKEFVNYIVVSLLSVIGKARACFVACSE